MDSVEGKVATIGIRWCKDRVEWSGFIFPALHDPRDKVLQRGPAPPVKYVRLVRRKAGAGERNRFYAQLICEGTPYRREPPACNRVSCSVPPLSNAVWRAETEE